MPRYVSVPTDATPHLIRQAYEAGGAYQWAREAWRNSQESGADRVYFDVERQAAESQGVLRRVIVDNGAGMEPEDMRVFLTTFGGGGKPIGVDSNFGQGFKSSVLPWNPYGVVVISYTAAHPDGSMLWIEREQSGNYALREWQVEDEFGDVGLLDVVVPFEDHVHGCDWAKIQPGWLRTGTIMVLLGATMHADTIDGDPDPARGETSKGLVRYLNSRLFDLSSSRQSETIDTTAVDLETVATRGPRGNKDVTLPLPDGRLLALHQRKVNGMRFFIPSEAALSGSIVVDSHGTVVDWHYIPEPNPPVGGSADYIAQKPVVVVDYQGEAYHADASKHRYRQFGITDEIMGRTWLVVRPPVYSDQRHTQWGVLTQASRNMLIAKGGGDLPWEEWGDTFYHNFPEELASARDAARSKVSAHADPAMSKNLSRILDRLNPRFKASRLVSSAVGKIVGYSTGARVGMPGVRPAKPVTRGGTSGGGGGTQGTDEIITAAKDGPISAAEKIIRSGYPTYFWKKFDLDESKFLADYNPKDSRVVDGVTYFGVVNLNLSHPVFVQEFDYWATNVWPKADPAKISELVQRVYGEEAVAHVVHAQRLNGTVVGRADDGIVIQMGRDDVEELLGKPALSAALLGLVNVEQRLLTQGGGLFGSRSNA